MCVYRRHVQTFFVGIAGLARISIEPHQLTSQTSEHGKRAVAALVNEEMAQHAFEVLNARPRDEVRSLMFVYAPSPPRLIVDVLGKGQRYWGHCELLILLRRKGSIPESGIVSSTLSWPGEFSGSFAEQFAGDSAINALPPDVRQELLDLLETSIER
jgi:hypothetical protein